jgi:DNA-binding transcriptional LysR family regulator
MNILHLKYAVEVEKTSSINKAADNLFMGQPNLSRAIKELEDSLGIIIFKRTSRGMTPTPQGQEFLGYAKKILEQIDQVENIYREGLGNKQKFSISVPRVSYISHAFTEFVKNIETTRPAEIFYKETNSMRSINNILQADYKLGIIRYQNVFDKYFKSMLDEKDLTHEMITEFKYVILISEEHELATKEDILFTDLSKYIEITHADPYVPSLPFVEVKKAELSEYVDKRIFVFERGSQFDLLCNVHSTFMWVSPLPDELLSRFNLVQRECKENTKTYRDVLIHRKNYHLTDLDNQFITEIVKSKRQYLS